MITPAYGLTATERVLPRLALDWTTGLAQAGVDVTRAGVATFVGSNGLIQSASVNTQRVDYTTGTAGLLVEEARTNIFVYSNDFANIAWTKADCAITASAVDSPDGTTNASKLVPNTNNAVHRMFLSSRGAAGAHTVSAYMKQGGYTFGIIRCEGVNTFFNLANGTLGTVGAGITASITPAANGFYRCVVTKTLAGATISTIGAGSADGIDAFIGDNVKGIYVYGSQMEAGAFATSYIPTTTTALTRNADVATMTGTNFSDWFNASEGTFVALSANMVAGGYSRALQVSDNTTSNFINVTTTLCQIRAAGTFYASFSSGGSVAGQFYQTTVAYKTNNCASATDGATIQADATVTLPTVSQMVIGGQTTTNIGSGWIKKIMYWPSRLTNNEVQAFSKQG